MESESSQTNKAMKTPSFRRRFLRIIASLVLSASMVSGQIPQVAPLNPEFELLFQRGAKPVESNYGLIPIPIDLSYLAEQVVPQKFEGQLALAPAYDLRAIGKVNGIRDQGPYGTCWAYATFGSMESFLLPSEDRDFSENHLVNLDGFDYAFEAGGHFFMSMAYLAGWHGPVDEIDDPYPNPSKSPLGLLPRKHVQQVRIIPGKSGPTGNDIIKQALMDHGALYATYYHGYGYFNSANNAYRYTGSNRGNHAVTLVGWDDGFDRNKFSDIPPGDGAYIVKNSWGSGWGENGFFHVSYYDARFGYETMCAFHSADEVGKYGAVYDYDPLGWVANLGISTTTFWGANVFTAMEDGDLDSVGFYANSLNTNYTILVYTGVSVNEPRSGTLAATATGTSPSAGYHTIKLESMAALTEGERFSIVLMLTTPGYNYPLPIEYVISGYSSAASAAPGQSYWSSVGETWFDLTSWNATANFCIKGFTLLAGSPEIAIEHPEGTALDDGGSAIAFDGVTVGGITSARQFTIRNTGDRFLRGLSVTIDGPDSGDFILNTTGMKTMLAPAGSTTFTVAFNPAGAESRTSAVEIHIASNDVDESSFDIELAGLVLSTTGDMDEDGLNDWAEYRYAALGFDWRLAQAAMVETLLGNANCAGLFNKTQIQALAIDTPLITRDPVTECFKLTIGLRKSTDLLEWAIFPFTSPGTTLNGDGQVEFEFTVPDNAAFFRLQGR
jgi:C1A family cysteine protease